jgi:thiosulfate dehydrogenase [quinone] large subunit
VTSQNTTLATAGDAVHRGHILYERDVLRSSTARKALAALRFVIGWSFLWPFIDKVFGLGYATPIGKGMIDGGHPARGYLGGVTGWFAGLFHPISNMGPVVDVVFMAALLAIGTALILGIGLKVAAFAGPLLLGLMYLAEFPLGVPSGTYTNPLFDDHWIMALAIIFFALVRAGDEWGFGIYWSKKVGDGWLR